MTKNFIQSITFASFLGISGSSPAIENEVGVDIIDAKTQVSKILEIKQSNIQEEEKKQEEFFSRLIALFNEIDILPDEEKADFIILFTQPDFRYELYEILKSDISENNFENILRSIFLGFLYGGLFYSYKKNKFGDGKLTPSITFAFLSAGAIYELSSIFQNAFIVSEMMAIGMYAYHFYIKNKSPKGTLTHANINNIDFLEQKAEFLQPFQNFTEPVVAYDSKGNPLLWNKAMEYETGYSSEEIMDFHKKGVDIMDLLYKGENREKVRKYLDSLKGTDTGYRNITFTLTTKYGEEKTFLWSLVLDADGSTLRFARHIENLEEIRAKLIETEQKLLRDKLTGAYNMEALQEDFRVIINNKRRKTNYVKVMFDIDNFKSVNDKFGHEIGNKVLIELVRFIKSKIRESDKVYRLHGDEFVILFESDNLNQILHKVNMIREEFYNYTQNIEGLQKSIGTSWGMVDIPPGNPKMNESIDIGEIMKQADKYMYVVKYFGLISEELIQRGVISCENTQKNAIGCPKFNNNREFVGVDIISSEYIFFLDLDDLELINKRKQELDDNNMRTGEN